MAKFTDAVKATLKGYFNAGDQPTEAQFASLMDAIQEGIEEHDHAGTGDGDGIQDIGPITDLVIRETNSVVQLSLECYDDGGSESRLYLQKSDTDTLGDLVETDADDWLGLVGFQGVNTSLAWGYGAYLLAKQTGAAGVTYIETDLILQTYSSTGAHSNQLVLNGETGCVGIKEDDPAGKLHIDQSVGDAAIPVLVLDQADVSEGFINFIGSDRGVIGEGINSVKSVRVELGGVVYRLALFANA